MFTDIRKILARSVGILILLAIIIFAYFRYANYLQGPELVQINLEPFMTVDAPSLSIAAEIKNTQAADINGRNLILKEKKYIEEIVVFSPGENILELELQDSFGKKKKYTYHIYYRKLEEKFPNTLDAAQKAYDTQNAEAETEEILIKNNQ